MTPHARKGFIGVVIWYLCMIVGFYFGNSLLFWTSFGLCLVAVVSTITFMSQGK